MSCLHLGKNYFFGPCLCFILIFLTSSFHADDLKGIKKKDLLRYRERVVGMFYHAYDSYLKYAYPYDELRPLSCDGHDTWGSYSLTLIDALDTLVILGNHSEFRRIAQKLIDKSQDFFDLDINASVFETNIRVVGGLLSAHLLQHRAGMVLEPGWPCSGPLLRMAEVVARKLLPAFDTPTGMPYGTVNLRYGVPKGETTVTCTAGVGTILIEFGTLSRLTGDPIFEKVAMKALRSLWEARSPLGLVGNHIDVSNSKWTALDSGVGGGIDSYFEYLVKGAIMFQIPELLEMFREYEKTIVKHLKRDDWYMWAHMKKGGITLPLFTSLDCFWPGIQSMLGDIDKAMKTIHNFHQVWKQFGFTPEYYNIPKAEVHLGREGYPLRPELIESTVYLYQATKDPYLLDIGIDILEAIEHSSKTSCGYATVKDVRDHRLEDRMESFFLAETTKYLYLLFDTDNFIHNSGGQGTVIKTPSGECVIDAGGYIFNTEAHPLDMAAVHCCSAQKKKEDTILQEFHDNLNLLELLNISDVKASLILGKKMKRKEKRGNKHSAYIKDREREEKEKKDEVNRVVIGKAKPAKNSNEIVNEVEAKDTINMDQNVDTNENVSRNGVDKAGAQETSQKEISGNPTADNGNKEITREKEHTKGHKKEQVMSDKTDSKNIKLGGGQAMKLGTVKPTIIKLEEKTTNLGRKKHTLHLASQLLDLFKGFTGSSEDCDTTKTPNVNDLYTTMKDYELNYTTKPEILHCPSLPFHYRLSVLGEMFDEE